jgi:hypothetical protein
VIRRRPLAIRDADLVARHGTVQRERFAEALAEGVTIVDAARRANVAERTARRWWTEPDMRADVARRQAEAVEATTARLAALSTKALDVLDVALDDVKLGPGGYRRARLALGVLAEHRARRDAERAGVLERLEADVAELRASVGTRNRLRAVPEKGSKR